MEFYDITDEFIDERTKRAKKSDSDKSEKTSKVKYISDIDFVKREKKPRKPLVISGRVLESKNPIKIFCLFQFSHHSNQLL